MNEEKYFTRYITKYALTRGIMKIQARLLDSGYTSEKSRSGGFFWKTGVHDFATLAEARVHAEEMRVKKLALLAKQIDKLERLKIKDPCVTA